MKGFIRLYKIYHHFLKGYKWIWFLSLSFTFIVFFVHNSIIYLIKDLVDSITTNDGNVITNLLLITGIMAVPIIIEPIGFIAKAYYFKAIISKIVSKLYYNILKQDYAFHINRQTGKLISKVLQAQHYIHTFVWDFEFFLFQDIASLFIPILLVATLHPYISLATLTSVIFFTPFIYASLKRNVKTRKIVRDSEYKRSTLIVDGISNFETVRSFGSEDHELSVLQQENILHEKAMWDHQTTHRYNDITTGIASLGIFLSATLVAAYLYTLGDITVGGLLVVVTYQFRFTENIMSLFFRIRHVMTQTPILEDVANLLEIEATINEPKNNQSRNLENSRIQFKNITFGYTKKTKVLDNLSLTVHSKQTVAFVGPSGGGKTTLIKLLMRYYDTNSGSILIDGINIKDLTYKDLRNLFGLVPQEPVLFNRTIFENVAYALNLQSDEDYEAAKPIVEEACKNAEIHDFIMTLPEKYKTKVGERGLKLSGGQKQRIAIARVLIKDPQIVIFDEATSMLDSESEQAIQKAFTKLSKDKTTIVIAHRLSTITNSDKIFVIDEGEITESGSHQELLDIKGEYAKLWNIQSGGFVKG